PITITASTNDSIISLRIYKKCTALADPSIGSFIFFNYLGGGNYEVNLNEEDSDNPCFKIAGTIPENQDSLGTTKVSIEAFFTKEGNVVGFQDTELKRPHGEYLIIYEFSPDTYIE